MTTPTIAISPSGHLDVVLRLMDHQIVGPEGELVGNVDDLQVAEVGGRLVITHLLVGPEALGHRLPGVLGRWTLAVWRRLRSQEEPVVTRLSLDHLVRLDSAAHVSPVGSHLLRESFGLEAWLREHVVSRIPGARAAPKEGSGEPPVTSESPRHTEVPSAELHRVSQLMGFTVHDSDGRVLGPVADLRCRAVTVMAERVGPLEVVGVSFGRHGAGSRLGYNDRAAQGPWLIRTILQRLHRNDRYAAWQHVQQVDWSAGTVRLRAAPALVHPLEAGEA